MDVTILSAIERRHALSHDAAESAGAARGGCAACAAITQQTLTHSANRVITRIIVLNPTPLWSIRRMSVRTSA
jgi:hypothetical protein